MIAEIKLMLDRYKAWTKKQALRSITGVLSLNEAMISDELSAFVETMKPHINHGLDHFRDKFKAFCAAHAFSPEDAISIADNPRTKTNIVLFILAKKLFNPQNLKEMLAILTPHVTHCVRISIPEVPASDHRLFERKAIHNGLQPIVEITSVDALENLPITKFSLETCVFSDNMILILNDSAFDCPLPFQWHLKCYHALQEISPALAAKLYTHNFDFRLLLTDIEAYQHLSTPYSMITHFIWGLELSGKHYTGSETDASFHALNVVARFFEVFNQIPEHVRFALYELTNTNNQTLASILELLNTSEKYHGSCVESAAFSLKTFLETQRKNPLMHYKISQPKREVNARACYETRTLSITRDTTHNEHYPFGLVESVASTVIFDSFDDFVYFLIRYPIAVYPGFLLNAHFNSLTRLAPAIQSGVFTGAQIIGLFNVFLMKATQLGFEFYSLLSATTRTLLFALPIEAHVDIRRAFTNVNEMNFYNFLLSSPPYSIQTEFDYFNDLALAFRKTLILSYIDVNCPITDIIQKKAFWIQHRSLTIDLFDEAEHREIINLLIRNLRSATKSTKTDILHHTVNMLTLFNGTAELSQFISTSGHLSKSKLSLFKPLELRVMPDSPTQRYRRDSN